MDSSLSGEQMKLSNPYLIDQLRRVLKHSDEVFINCSNNSARCHVKNAESQEWTRQP